jgi:uncharacterized protein YceH (UPF0502 family)
MIEKAMTTPDHYPMSLNAVVTACNQVSNRDPIVTYDEPAVELVLRGLADRSLAKMVHRPGDRVVKYRHALDAALETTDKETALVAVLLLRGTQTPGELRQRTQRYVEFISLGEVEATLENLRHRDDPIVDRLDRRPGQKEHRYRHLLGTEATDGEPTPAVDSSGDEDGPGSPPPAQAAAETAGGDELATLRAEVADLRARVEHLEREFGLD